MPGIRPIATQKTRATRAHGGIGGWQSHPFALVPSSWSEVEAPIVGVRSMHEALRGWLAETGLELKPHAAEETVVRSAPFMSSG
ncbi:MAG: hypothetical protein ACRDK5_07340 [Solirubrobacterales bacterium]